MPERVIQRRCRSCGTHHPVAMDRHALLRPFFCSDVCLDRFAAEKARSFGYLGTPDPRSIKTARQPQRENPSKGTTPVHDAPAAAPLLSVDEIAALSEGAQVPLLSVDARKVAEDEPAAALPADRRPGVDPVPVRAYLEQLLMLLDAPAALLDGETDHMRRALDLAVHELAWVLGDRSDAPKLVDHEAVYLRRALAFATCRIETAERIEFWRARDAAPPDAGKLVVYEDEVEGCTARAAACAKNVSLATVIFLGVLVGLYFVATAFGWEVPR